MRMKMTEIIQFTDSTSKKNKKNRTGVQLILMAAARAAGATSTPASVASNSIATAANTVASSKHVIEGSMEFDQRCSNSLSAEEAHARKWVMCVGGC